MSPRIKARSKYANLFKNITKNRYIHVLYFILSVVCTQNEAVVKFTDMPTN